MFGNLKPEEFVDSLKRLLVLCPYAHPCPCFGLLKFVMNLVMEFLHDGRSEWCCVVNEHRHVEVALRKHFGDVGKVHADFIPASFVRRVIRLNFDSSTVFE